MNVTSPSTIKSPSSSNLVSISSIASFGSVILSVASTMTSISATISVGEVTSETLISIPFSRANSLEARLALTSSSNPSASFSITEAISANVSASSLVMV